MSLFTAGRMMQWTKEDPEGSSNVELHGKPFRTWQNHPPAPIRGFSIDTRTLQPGEMFIALKGNRLDGHSFVEEALTKGAVGALVAREWFSSAPCVPRLDSSLFVVVPDPLFAMQALARWHRQSFHGPLIGITGSNGKTTTKEMLAAILARRGLVLKNEGNLNNAIGLPLSLLRLTGEERAAILEMGISRPGEMRRLCEIARPTVGLITNIGPTHLEFLGNLETVAAEKQLLFEAIQSDGTAILNLDDPYLALWKDRANTTWTYGIQATADVTAAQVESHAESISFTLQFHRKESGGGRIKIVLPLWGEYQVYNALAASTTALALGYAFDEIRDALSTFHPPMLRGEVIQTGGVLLLLDTYNANPASMTSALRALSIFSPSPVREAGNATRGVPGKNGTLRKVAILGDMLELGETSVKAHWTLGKKVAEHQIDCLIAVGRFSSDLAKGALQAGMAKEAIFTYETVEEVDLSPLLHKGDLVLLKGSRGMKMEQLLHQFPKEEGAATP